MTGAKASQTTGKPPRVGADYWVALGLRRLAEQGPDGLTIDGLCRAASKTKGSFYAHFTSHDAFLLAVIARWRAESSAALIASSSVRTDPTDRLLLLNRLAIMLDPALERGIYRLAERNPQVAAAVMAVDDLRLAYLASLYRAMGQHSDQMAADLAAIEYAAFVGFQRPGAARDSQEFERLHQVFLALVSGAAVASRSKRG